MEDREILEQINDILTKKYEPLLIIKIMRMPDIKEIEGFRQYIKKEFGYNAIIFPGEMESDVKLLSVINSDPTKIEDIQKQMTDLIERLKNESAELPKA
jgi:hypothetical protein